jgi:hypothetical protein
MDKFSAIRVEKVILKEPLDCRQSYLWGRSAVCVALQIPFAGEWEVEDVVHIHTVMNVDSR